jgi:hypothetical protein
MSQESNAIYENYQDQIEKVINTLAYASPSFSYFDSEDIKAEIRIICLEAIKTFNPKKATIETFLNRCIKTRMQNFKRDNFFRYENPCIDKKCIYYDIFNKKCISEEKCASCSLIKKSSTRMQAKIAIGDPVLFSASESEIDKEDKVFSIKRVDDILDIREIILRKEGPEYLLSFDIFCVRDKNFIKKSHFEKIKDIILDYYNG